MKVVVSNLKHVNLILENKAGDIFSVCFDDNCGALKKHLGRPWVLVYDKREKDIVNEEWVGGERFLELLADFFGKKVVDKEDPVKK